MSPAPASSVPLRLLAVDVQDVAGPLLLLRPHIEQLGVRGDMPREHPRQGDASGGVRDGSKMKSEAGADGSDVTSTSPCPASATVRTWSSAKAGRLP